MIITDHKENGHNLLKLRVSFIDDLKKGWYTDAILFKQGGEMLKKGWKRSVTLVLAVTFLMTSVVMSPLAAHAAQESEAQVQEENAEVVQSNQTGNEANNQSSLNGQNDQIDQGEEANNVDSNAANNPDAEANTSEESSEAETTGGESSESDVVDDVELEESQIAAEGSMELESISLYSNANARLLSSAAMFSARANNSNMGLAPGIAFYKYEINYNKYTDYNNVEYIVIHDTGNPKPGADAMAHYQFFAGGNREASAHYFVDDKQVVQIIDDSEGSWHCGIKYKTPATPISNHNSLGIEMCINPDGNYNKAMTNTIDLAAYLLWKYNLDIDHLVRHYDAGTKVCPLTMADNNWARWWEFKAAVKAKLGTYNGQFSGEESGSTTWYNNPIQGSSTMSADTMVAFLMKNNTGITKAYAQQVANAYLTIGSYYGIRGDIAFFQAMLETGYLKYGGEANASYYNFCGLKNGDGTDYATFNSPEEGIEAHIQHLYSYASKNEIPSGRKLLDPRFKYPVRGSVTKWEGLGGKWAVPGYDPKQYSSLEDARNHHDSYGEIIVRLYVTAGGSGVQADGSSGYWDDPVYTGPAAGLRNELQLGSTGSDVKEVQGYLKTIGYSYVAVTGTFDANTQRAVKDIQTKNKLTSDGVVGTDTWTVIINTYVECVTGGSVTPSEPTNPSNPSDPSTTHATISYGSTGSDVLEMQKLLNKLGYGLDEDGIFGRDTETAVKKFQSANGIGADGVVGPKTWAALIKMSESGSTNPGTSTTRPQIQKGSTGEAVKELQQILSRLGYSVGADGIFGNTTEAMVKRFQAANGIGADGIVGPKTWNVLTSGNANGNTTTNPGTSTTRPQIQKGSSGEAVKELQQILSRLGYPVGADGIFGNTTETMVKRFQAANGIGADGIVGPKTWNVLTSSNANGNTTTRATLRNGSTGADVKVLQQLLVQHGYQIGIDGIFGSGTEAAVKRFQAANGIGADGIVGPKTWAAL